MTQVPTTTRDSLRPVQVIGNGFRGDSSAADIHSSAFLQSLLAFSSTATAGAVTADLHLNQLVGALQFNRPGGTGSERPAAEPIARERTREPQPFDDEDDAVEQRAAAASQPQAAAVAADLAVLLAESTLTTGAWPAAGDAADRPLRPTLADQRAAGFPTAERAAAIESGLLASPKQVAELTAASLNAVEPVATPDRFMSGVSTTETERGFRLDGRWQRVAGEETLAGWSNRAIVPNAAVGDSAAVSDLGPLGQRVSLPESLDPAVVHRAVGESGPEEAAWQLSFQSDRAGVRAGRVNTGAKSKARPGLLPDGGVERASRLIPQSLPNHMARQEGVFVGPVPRQGGRFSLDELALVPAAARALSEAGLGSANAPLMASSESVATEILTGNPVPGGTTSAFASNTASTVDAVGLSAAVATTDTATTEIAMGSLPGRSDSSIGIAVDGAEPAAAGGSRTLPTRLLNQVAQALRQAPVGDSTLRLQLNPIDLGQLSIEIAFRDGVMHGKLRAEQGQTLKWLQEGLEGLKARLSDQGIVVQTLEVELGQQGDFSQQSGSFSPGPDFGRPRSGRGFFSPDDASRRNSGGQPDVASPATPRETSGQWAVNVVV